MLQINTHFFRKRPRREYLYDDYHSPKPGIYRWIRRLMVASLLILLGIFISLYSDLANAEGTSKVIIEADQLSEGSLLIKTDQENHFQKLPTLNTAVDINVSAMIARSRVVQQFRNNSEDWIEATYMFPLPENAAVDHMKIKIGSRTIEGQIKEKNQAKKIYSQAKRAGKKAALLAQHRPNIFSTAVANIAPQETIEIEIEYQQILHYDQGAFSLRFPMAITPRYNPENNHEAPQYIRKPTKAISEDISLDQQAQLSHVYNENILLNSPYLSGLEKERPVSIRVHLKPGFALKKVDSPYHNIHQQNHADGSTEVTLENKQVPANRDFQLTWTPDIGKAPKASMLTETIDDEHYQLTMILPSQKGVYAGQPLARDMTYVIDTSGSMYGTSIEQAKSSLLMSLERLRLHDRFNIIQFNSTTHQLFSASKPASFRNIERARQYIRSLRADGGTEMLPALTAALSDSEDKAYVKQIIFLTDGSVGNEAALFQLINKKLNQHRLFTIGIGSAPNSYFMRKAAQMGRGTFTYIGKLGEVKEKMDKLFSKLETPVLTNLQVHYDKSANVETWPEKLPDLYQGEPVVFVSKSSKPLKNITIEGTRALSPWKANINAQKHKLTEGIGVLWARKKIESLNDKKHQGEDKEKIRKAITEIALQHHIVSDYTSLVAVDISPSRTMNQNIKNHKLALPIPHGQSAEKIFGRLPQTATDAELQLFLGSLLLLLAFLSQLIPMPCSRK